MYFLDGINARERDAREFLSEELSHSDLVAFFNVPQAAHQDQVRNIHRNLNINAIKLGQALETSSFFSRRIKRMEEEKSEIKNVHIFINGKKIVAIEKNEKQQRNYSFKKSATCDIEISWNAKDTSEKDLSCVIVLSINSGQISIGKSTINDQNIEPKNILELAKQNEAVLIEGKALHEVLGECLVQQTPCEEKENIQPRENITAVSSSVLDDEVTVEEAILRARGKWPN
jgi:hypothetical protein